MKEVYGHPKHPENPENFKAFNKSHVHKGLTGTFMELP